MRTAGSNEVSKRLRPRAVGDTKYQPLIEECRPAAVSSLLVPSNSDVERLHEPNSACECEMQVSRLATGAMLRPE